MLPHPTRTEEDVNILDKAQSRAARYACNNYTKRTPGCVTTMVSPVGWRRKIHRLFQVKHNLVEILESESIIRSDDSRTRGSQRLFAPYTNVTIHLYKCRSFQGPFRTGTNCRLQSTAVQTIEAFKTVLHSPATIHNVTSHGCT